MPFTKTGKDSYTSPSGRRFNGAQVRLYYANGGHFPGEQGYAGGGNVSNKGYMGKDMAYAAGGPVIGKDSEFLKTPDRFRGSPVPKPEPTQDVFGKGSKKSAPKAKDKSEKPILPR